MTIFTMESALPYLRGKRVLVTALSLPHGTPGAARYAVFSFAFAAFAALLTALAAAIGGAAWFPALGSPVAATLRHFVLALGVSVFFYPSLLRQATRRPRGGARGDAVRLYLGEATGELAARKHQRAAARGENLVLASGDACQNICVNGGIGGGKTSRVIHPLLLQLLDQKCGGLIFDIKGNFVLTVRAAARAVSFDLSKLHFIGPGLTRINLIEGLTPEQAAYFLRAAMSLGGLSEKDPIWINNGENWCRAGLGVLYYLDRFSLNELNSFIFNPAHHAECLAELEVALPTLTEREQRIVQSYLDFLRQVAGWDERFKTSVEGTISQILAPFTHPDLVDAFCTHADAVSFDEALKGSVFVVDMPIKTWGLGGRVAYLFLKLRFFSLIDERQSTVTRDDLPAFFMCDEYQNVISADRQGGLSDVTFWDKSRSAKLIGVISWQGIASLYGAIGNRDLADSIEQNFRQKIFFRTEDEHTLQHITRILGPVEQERESKTTGTSSHKEHTTKTESQSQSEHETALISARHVRQLGPDQAIAILNISGYAVDDVVNFVPIYVENEKPVATPATAAMM